MHHTGADRLTDASSATRKSAPIAPAACALHEASTYIGFGPHLDCLRCNVALVYWGIVDTCNDLRK